MELKESNMKRTITLILASMLLTLTACTGGSGPDNTAAPTEIVSNETAVPGATENPYPTQDPARAAFDPETDHDDRNMGFLGSIAETEDAYYIMTTSGSGFLLFYDKAAGYNGILCPKPECLHDLAPTRKELAKCSGNIGDPFCSLTYYEGRLYWITYYLPERDFCTFSMALDGSDRQLVGVLGLADGKYQPQQVWIHRGYFYFYSEADTVIDGAPSRQLAIVREPLAGGEKQEIYVKKSYMGGEWTLRFIGDDVYILAGYDDADGSVFEYGEPQTPEDLSLLQEHTVILRWNPGMKEPEVLLDEESLNQPSPDNFRVERDGTVWFVRHRPEDPSIDPWDEEKEYKEIDTLCRLDPDGTVTELFDSAFDGDLYNMRNIFDGGVIMLRDLRTKPGYTVMCIADLDGNVVFKGDLPMAFLDRIAPGASDKSLEFIYPQIIFCERDGFIACFDFYYPNDETHPTRQYIVRYDITADGLTETFLAESMTVIYHE